jgi:hypothetical protein
MKIEQFINLKFFMKLKNTPTKGFQMLKEVYGDNVLSCTRVFEWQKRFMEGWEEVEDDERLGCHLASKTEENVEKISEIVRKDGRLRI